MSNSIALSPKTSKLALFSAGCAATIVFFIFVAYPIIVYVDNQFAEWDDWGMVFLAGIANLIVMLSILLGLVTGLMGLRRIKRSEGTLKGDKIALTGVVICSLPIIALLALMPLFILQ